MPLSEKLTFWITNVVLLALLAGCSSKEQPKNTALTPYPVASQVASPSEAGSVSAVFTPKELPDLGTVNQALDDTAIVLQLVVNGKTSDGITEIPKTSMAGVTPNPIAVKEGYPLKGRMCAVCLTQLLSGRCTNSVLRRERALIKYQTLLVGRAKRLPEQVPQQHTDGEVEIVEVWF